MELIWMSEKPSEYSFDEIELGMQKSFKVDISKNMLDVFGRDTGDYNPLHMSEEYASSTSFKKRVCSGMFLASFFSRLVGMYLPGKHALHISQSLTFVNNFTLNSDCFANKAWINKIQGLRYMKRMFSWQIHTN